MGDGRLAYANLTYEGGLVGLLLVLGPTPQPWLGDDERLLLRGLADQSALAIVNTRLYKDARRRLERLQALRTIHIAITNNGGIQATLDVLLEQITQRLGVDAALVLLFDAADQRLVYAAGRGFRSEALRATRLRLGGGRAGQAALQRRILVVPDLTADPGAFTDAPLLNTDGFVSYFAAPLIVQDEVRGVLEVFHRVALRPDPEWLDFLEAWAGQAAIAIDNTTLVADLQHSHSELALAYDATIEGWSHALDLRDHETEGHTQRVTEMTLALAQRVGRFDAAALVHLRRGALLHDIGKMGVPDSILHKPGPLTDAEWVVMRRHPTLTYAMLRVIEYLWPALDIPYAHHEKWDGRLPARLAGPPHSAGGAPVRRGGHVGRAALRPALPPGLARSAGARPPGRLGRQPPRRGAGGGVFGDARAAAGRRAAPTPPPLAAPRIPGAAAACSARRRLSPPARPAAGRTDRTGARPAPAAAPSR